jgi:hypothetical protein
VPSILNLRLHRAHFRGCQDRERMGRIPGPGGSGGRASLGPHRHGVGVRGPDPVGVQGSGSRTGARRKARLCPPSRPPTGASHRRQRCPAFSSRPNRRPSCLSGSSAGACDPAPFEVPGAHLSPPYGAPHCWEELRVGLLITALEF